MYSNEEYQHIEKAINHVFDKPQHKLSFEEIAVFLNLSPVEFQNILADWGGGRPNDFLDHISTDYAKRILKEKDILRSRKQPDLFIEEMTFDEYNNKGQNSFINYHYTVSLFGDLLIASTIKGVCYMGFSDDRASALFDLKQRFKTFSFIEKPDSFQECALQSYLETEGAESVKVHLRGTDFQLKVWHALLKIPKGGLSTYGEIAEVIEKPKASRAVGRAIACNPVSLLIPCHRVIQKTGNIGGYMWGRTRKAAIIGWEANHREF